MYGPEQQPRYAYESNLRRSLGLDAKKLAIKP
jgi:hypothetical protein